MEWISVNDQLPKNNSGLYLRPGRGGIKFICHRKDNAWIRSPQMKRVVGITHWMPLPAAPEQNK